MAGVGILCILSSLMFMRICTYAHTHTHTLTDHNPNAMFVRTTYGGHVAFFEGGMLVPNPFSWVDRLIVEYSQACINLEDNYTCS